MTADSQSTGLEVLDRLESSLRDVAAIIPERSANELRVPAAQPDGFDVTLLVEQQTFMVGFGALWHEHFGSAAEATWWFVSGLLGQMRIIETTRGEVTHWSRVQCLGPEGAWESGAAVGAFFFPFWRRRSRRPPASRNATGAA